MPYELLLYELELFKGNSAALRVVALRASALQTKQCSPASHYATSLTFLGEAMQLCESLLYELELLGGSNAALRVTFSTNYKEFRHELLLLYELELLKGSDASLRVMYK